MLTWDILKILNIIHIKIEQLMANGIPKLVKRLSKSHSDQSNNYIQIFLRLIGKMQVCAKLKINS